MKVRELRLLLESLPKSADDLDVALCIRYRDQRFPCEQQIYGDVTRLFDVNFMSKDLVTVAEQRICLGGHQDGFRAAAPRPFSDSAAPDAGTLGSHSAPGSETRGG